MHELRKYYQVFVVSLSEMFVWKLNFVLWRVRTVLQLLLLYFLWSTVFLQQDVVFGYQRTEILTYVLGVAFLRSLVLSSRSIDIAGEIRDGELTNFLLRPVSYFAWWLMRDLADKLINVLFVVVEIALLWFLFQPEVVLQVEPLFVATSIIAAFLALILFFYFSFLISLTAFWIAEVWGVRFILGIILEFFAGGFFPLDILPVVIFRILQFTPFPYMLFFPMKVYLGQIGSYEMMLGFTVLVVWIVFFVWLTRVVWFKGLKLYGAEGR